MHQKYGKVTKIQTKALHIHRIPMSLWKPPRADH